MAYVAGIKHCEANSRSLVEGLLGFEVYAYVVFNKGVSKRRRI